MKDLHPKISLILQLVGLICLLTGCSAKQQAIAPIEPPKPESFLGISLTPAIDSTQMLISGVIAGPFALALRQLEITELNDAILKSINNTSITQLNWQQIIGSLIPGEDVTVQIQHGHEAVLLNMDVMVGNKYDWQGPIKKSDGVTRKNLYLKESEEFLPIKKIIQQQSHHHQQQDAVVALHEMFNDWQNKHHGFHHLSRVHFPFQQPMHLLELEQVITRPLSHSSSRHLTSWLAENLDLESIEPTSCKRDIDKQYVIDAYLAAKEHLTTAFAPLNEAKQLQIIDDLNYLLSELSLARLPINHRDPARSINAMNASMLIDYSSLLLSMHAFSCLLNNQAIAISALETNLIPIELQQAVTGDIQQAIKINNDWFVIGGVGTNRYDMSKLAIVYDPNGNDEYYSSEHTSGQVKLVIDKQGNDKYQTDNGGPASAWLGLSMLIDFQGDDTYTGELAANGVGMMGIGLLIDHQGQDIYTGNWFSNGVAFYGAGMIIDLGKEADRYQSYAFSQALGGPRGLGLIFNESGDDQYISTGQLASVYGVKDEFASFSQGFGFGIRQYDSGGIGILFDQRGNDTYEGGEFSQGGAYYWGLGILHDSNGNDVYKANRYAQGFGVHQATGIFIDEQGDDQYHATTAACQGAAWDVALGLLIDMQGNDQYTGEGLCQGAAAMQAQAWLIDLDGEDSYFATGNNTQGRSGTNTYHYDKTNPVYSWSLLLDAGGKTDHYSNKQRNDSTSANADHNFKKPGKTRAHGLFIDTSAILTRID